MTRSELRALVRERLASDELPAELPDLRRGKRGGQPITEVRIGTLADAQCTICGNPGPHVTYTYRGGRILRLHVACEAAWREEVADRRRSRSEP